MILRKDAVPFTEGASGYPGPYNLGRGHMRWQGFASAGGLSQFGAAFEVLDPGKRASQKHWHSLEDEFLYLISGVLTVVEGDTESAMHPGDAACWKAGEPVGHTIRNDGAEPACYLIVGTRDPADVCHYPGIDLRSEPVEGGGGQYVHLDGTPWEEPR
jgi:uncharacterized cupin superfamily protein